MALKGQAASSKFPQIRVDQATYDLTKAYADEMGLPLTTAVSQALQDWLSTVGEARLEYNRRSRKSLSLVRRA